jgi:hypothetical protein
LETPYGEREVVAGGFAAALHTVEIPELSVPCYGACGELVFDVRADEQSARELRNQLGLLPADQIRTNREELGLTQRQLA